MDEIIKKLEESYKEYLEKVKQTHPYCFEVTEDDTKEVAKLSKDVKFIYKGAFSTDKKLVHTYYACFPTEEEAKRVFELLEKKKKKLHGEVV